MEQTFYVRIQSNVKQREVFSQILLRLAANFSFQGMEDWTVNATEKVLGAEAEFCDLRSKGEMSKSLIVYFGKSKDADAFRAILAKSFDGIKVSRTWELKPKDWMKEWRKYYRIQTLGKGQIKLLIIPSWYPAKKRGRWEVRIHPGQAFGTGTHPTTRLCLLAFMDIAKSLGSSPTILDFGAGTGVLGIAAAKFLTLQKKPYSILAVESDPVALEQAGKNIGINKVKIQSALKTPKKVAADLVFANVLAPVLLAHREPLMAAVKPGGYLILSGLLKTEVKDFTAAFLGASESFTTQKKIEGDWAALVLKRKKV